MELILASAGGAEIRTLPWNADIEAGGMNTFEIEVPRTAWNADAGFWQRVYVPGTEFGGMFQAFYTRLKSFEGETLSEKTESYMLSIGVTQEEIDSIRAIMLGE